MATPVIKTQEKKKGSNLTPRTRKSYFNSESFRNKTKNGIEQLKTYLINKGETLTRAHIETVKYFNAPLEREDRK